MKPIKIIIVGGGFGGVYTLKNLHKIFHKNEMVDITIITPKNYFLFTPLLHEVATGGINRENIIEPIRNMFECCNFSLHLGEVKSISLKEKRVETSTETFNYDFLVLAHGAETNFYDIEGAKENSFTLKSLEDAVKIKNHLISIFEMASREKDREMRKNLLRFVIVGGGATGVEISAEISEFAKRTLSRYYKKEIGEDVSIILLQKESEVLPRLSKSLREKSLNTLEKKGVEVLLNSSVMKVEKEKVILSLGRTLNTNTIIWVAGVKPISLSFEEEFPILKSGRIEVNEYLQIEKYPSVYVVGDSAGVKVKDELLPMLAQVAVREAKIVAENIKRQISNTPLKPYRFRLKGNFISLGRWSAVGEVYLFKAFLVFSGYFAWWLWRTIYLSKLISWRKKVKVAIDWTVNALSKRDISEI